MSRTSTRSAGLIYLVVVVTGLFTLGIVPSRLLVDGDPTRTVQNLVANEYLWRLGIVSGYVCYTAFLLLPLELYRVLHHVSPRAAVAMVALAAVSAPIAFLNQVHLLDILTLIGNASLTPEVMAAGVSAELSTYQNGQLMAQIFWGLWLLPFGYLVYRSGFLPKALGVVLMVGGVGYVTHFVATMLLPGYPEMAIVRWIRKPAGLGEMGAALWMAVRGAGRTRAA
ncbi:MAG: DUF4386 domain-containing protein [Gemmatimonadetes bacterium]|nr:DUF4386 domain-containing protein [Gemmatimonadota bacterium]